MLGSLLLTTHHPPVPFLRLLARSLAHPCGCVLCVCARRRTPEYAEILKKAGEQVRAASGLSGLLLVEPLTL